MEGVRRQKTEDSSVPRRMLEEVEGARKNRRRMSKDVAPGPRRWESREEI